MSSGERVDRFYLGNVEDWLSKSDTATCTRGGLRTQRLCFSGANAVTQGGVAQ
jgi:hypothetical protein